MTYRTMDIDVLKSIPVFAECDDTELARVAINAHEGSVPKGEVLVREGDFSDTVMAIVEGTADVIRDGKRIARLGPGDVFGEQGLLGGGLRSATIKATSAMRLVAVDSFGMRRLRKAHSPGFTGLSELAAARAL